MGDFKLTQINSVMLGTTDLTRSLAFYRNTLGLVVGFRDAWVRVPQRGWHHARTERGAREARDAGRRWHGDRVRGGDVTAAHEALSARGVEFLNAPRNVTGDQWAANFRDPDGHLLSIFGPEKA